jgi:hypothetical protein
MCWTQWALVVESSNFQRHLAAEGELGTRLRPQNPDLHGKKGNWRQKWKVWDDLLISTFLVLSVVFEHSELLAAKVNTKA